MILKSYTGNCSLYIFIRGFTRRAYNRNGKSALKQTIAAMIKIRFAFTCFLIKLQNFIISGASINTRGLIIGCIFWFTSRLACVQTPPPPLRKKSEKGFFLRGGGKGFCTQATGRWAITWRAYKLGGEGQGRC